MASGNAIRGSRVGAGPMGEAERGEAAGHQAGAAQEGATVERAIRLTLQRGGERAAGLAFRELGMAAIADDEDLSGCRASTRSTARARSGRLSCAFAASRSRARSSLFGASTERWTRFAPTRRASRGCDFRAT